MARKKSTATTTAVVEEAATVVEETVAETTGVVEEVVTEETTDATDTTETSDAVEEVVTEVAEETVAEEKPTYSLPVTIVITEFESYVAAMKSTKVQTTTSLTRQAAQLINCYRVMCGIATQSDFNTAMAYILNRVWEEINDTFTAEHCMRGLVYNGKNMAMKFTASLNTVLRAYASPATRSTAHNRVTLGPMLAQAPTERAQRYLQAFFSKFKD